MKNIVFTGGGTGGHIMPNLAIIDELKGYHIHYIGCDGMEKNILKDYKNIKFHEINAVRFVRSLTPKNLLIPFKLVSSINKCKEILQKINPVLIFSKGGFVSIPVCLAGSKLDIPILTHESDLTIGLANKIISRKAKFICCSFEETAKNYQKNALFTGSPIRKKIFNGNSQVVKSRHQINDDKPIILIIGGSLGATAINETIWQNIDDYSQKYTLIHIVGKNKLNQDLLSVKDYIQLEFVYDIENYYATCDMVISRAGSNTIFELLALCKPMLLIPLPKSASRGDQILNAENFKNNNFACVLDQENITKQTLITKINQTLSNKNFYIKNMKAFKNANGTKPIIDLINKYAKG